MIKKEELAELFPVPILISKKIIYRDGEMFILDMQKLLELEPNAHNEFIQNPEIVKRLILNGLEIYQKNISQTEHFKIKNFSYIHPISVLRVIHLGKLVKVNGMISKTTKVVAMVTSKKFECNQCGSSITTKGSDPKICSCGSRKFTLINTEFCDVQEIELEELQEDLGDKQPQKIRVRFMQGLCDKDISGSLQPGNKIEIIGIVEKISTNRKEEELFEYRVNAYDLNSLEERYNEELITEEDERQIKELSLNKPLEKLSGSLAPSISGHEELKKAIILQMAGGVKRTKVDGSRFRDRIHLLVVGDASTGKSHIAKCVKTRTPKAYYVSGDESSKAGLVAMVEKDELLNQWSVKTGALSKANDSILVIDEIDKLDDEDRNALHTPMESGEIVLNKAGIHTSLKSDCSILAIANPKGGMFEMDDNQTITKQINLPPTILSRFDLIFIMKDKIDVDNDSSIVDLIYSEKRIEQSVSIELFRKYIAYIKKLSPQRKPELLDSLKKFYNEVRAKSISSDSKLKGMPITPRHIEGLLRMADASAKIRMSEFVEEEDLKIAKDLFFNSLLKLGMDESTGLVDFARIGSGKTLSKKIKAKLILEILKGIITTNGWKQVADFHLKEKCLEKGISYEYEDLINELNKEGEIIMSDGGWKLPLDKNNSN